MNSKNQIVELVSSPCISVCEVNEKDICTGCYRSLDEIAAWRSLSPTEQKMIVELADKRRDEAKK